jgi:hypothetical protein
MLTIHWLRRMIASLACAFALTFSFVSIAADSVVSLATGGYASGLRSEELKNILVLLEAVS